MITPRPQPIDLEEVRARLPRRGQIRQDMEALLSIVEYLHETLHEKGRHDSTCARMKNVNAACDCSFDLAYGVIQPEPDWYNRRRFAEMGMDYEHWRTTGHYKTPAEVADIS